ncbi:MAG: helix-turn-helix domain-containing protein [Oceanicoccus sp.]|uniref:helix-turn-helix domain-containing protein n=1 Tax=Oceanicoccus sp. TaxID=2691044 RepID=UPI002629A6E0|nr:helix-turn-helix domain-containing protein [Oceanicoccus sp.]MDG1773724.1 helix-turn-helix domain-containing protein [Oceanicoccus sp.]
MALFSKPTARALAIIDLLMANPKCTYGLTDLTRRLKLNKATCHAILSTMKSNGFLLQDPKNKTYRLGPSMAAAGHAAISQLPSLIYTMTEVRNLSLELSMDCIICACSNNSLVTLAHYQHSDTRLPESGLRLPNIAPLGACFIAWSTASQLQQWISQGHETQDEYLEILDYKIRISVISILKRGYEVTLKTSAESNWRDSLNNTNTQAQEELNHIYQQSLFQEDFHLNNIKAHKKYSVSQITVPIFNLANKPELVMTVSPRQMLSGKEIEAIADRLKQASRRASRAVTESQAKP